MHALIHLGLVPNTNHPKLSETRSNLKVETTASEVRVLRPQLLNHRHYYRISNQSFPLYAYIYTHTHIYIYIYILLLLTKKYMDITHSIQIDYNL